MKLKRLLMVSEPGKNGVFVFTRSLVRHLHAAHPEIQVDLAYSSRRQLGEVDAFANEIRSHGDEAVDLEVGNAPEFADFAGFAKLAAMVHRRRPQLIHAHSSKAGALARVGRMLAGFPPVLYTPHAYRGLTRSGGGAEAFFNVLEAALGRIGETHNCSGDERDFAVQKLRLSPSSLHVIPHGIDTAAFAPTDAVEKSARRAALGIPPDGRLLVTVGRDCRQKNYAPLYAALEDLLVGETGLRFAHAGEGSVELRSALVPAARERCHAYRHLADTSVLLGAADGFILTSLYEGLSLSMLHALSSGLPLILTEAPGLRAARDFGFEEIEWLPDPAATDDLVPEIRAAILRWMALRTAALPAQRTLAVECFSEPVQFEKLVAQYESML